MYVSVSRFQLPVPGFVLIVLFGLVTACTTAPPRVFYPPEGGHPQGDPATPGAGDVPMPQGNFQPNADLYVCAGFHASNAPPTDASDRIIAFKPIIMVNGVVLSSVPVNDVCLTSGFGQRGGRMHKGLDLQSRPAGTIYSAAPGIILEARVSTGYGNMIVIGHGNGVFTRYAHMASFADGIETGQRLGFGQPLGIMGDSGNATAVHLHFEILEGNYDTPKRSFGLTAQDPFSFPAYVPQEAGT